MRNERVRTLVEIALSVALAAILATVKLQLPAWAAGGSISLSMLPIFIVALRRGLFPGVVTGALFGTIHYFQEPFFVSLVQVALDYTVAFALCGLAGIGAPLVRRARTGVDAGVTVAFVVLGGVGRFAASFVSGIVFFGQYAPEGQPVWIYSLIYNAGYLAPSLIACAVAAAVLVPVLAIAVPVGTARTPGAGPDGNAAAGSAA